MSRLMNAGLLGCVCLIAVMAGQYLARGDTILGYQCQWGQCKSVVRVCKNGCDISESPTQFPDCVQNAGFSCTRPPGNTWTCEGVWPGTTVKCTCDVSGPCINPV